ncbi:cytochrome P450 [Phanerochaete sordida]|uniref:Cytochrome P450 n=1 Tax=Phanerochaete sordida TaxID=48140 RepID=A0A9P3GDJ0_9APHY|nr:cytochrome P450 [Phanerochaete sordida]
MAVSLLTGVDAALLAVLGYVLFYLGRTLSRRVAKRATFASTRPPGPPGLPFVGNAYQIPHDRQWLKFDEWTKQYGDIVQISVMGQPTVIIGSAQIASDLLDARGAIYSDRPQAVMAGELVGWDLGLGYAPGPHSPRFREFRRLFQQFMGPRAAQEPTLLAAQEKNATKLLRRLLIAPEKFMTHVRQSTGALILYLTYGYEVSEDTDQDALVNIAEEAMQGFARASDPGAYMVDTLPWLKHIPEWFPGARFQQDAKVMRQSRERLYDVPYDFVQCEMAKGAVPRSFVASYIDEKVEPTAAEGELIKAAAASLYSGGADTTPSSLASLILAMTLYPEIQKRAQAELDTVIGGSWGRLPGFADRSNLPYIDAIVLEVLRWNTSVPLGLAHRLTQDDVYEGHHFAKGTVFWANIWTMLNDANIFPEPSRFVPERFLDENGRLRTLSRSEDPAVIGFGFGRRICPGMHFAHNSIFIAIARMLYVFNFAKARDQGGAEITPQIEYDGFISHPRPFPCSIVPRSKAAEDLILHAVQSE